MPDELTDLPVVPTPSRDRLPPRQLLGYRDHRERLVKWMLHVGKDPEQGAGYAFETVRRRCYNTDIFYRWVWDEVDRYTTQVTTDHADEYVRNLAYREMSPSNKTNIVKTLKMLFRWRAWEFGEENDWDPPVSYSQNDSPATPRDYLTREERKRVREAALEYGSIPHYNSLDSEGRQKWKRHLAHRYRKPIGSVTKEDFERANGWNIPSLVWASLDAGLRPVEVARATVRWVDVDNATLRIPAEESAKGTEHWRVSVRDQTAEALGMWLEERPLYEKYDDTDALWLTRECNPYRSTALKYVLSRLCDIAGISTEERQMTWYAIRHSVGTYMTREEGLAAARTQLRHKSVETTMKYDQTPLEDRREALDRMG